MDGWMSSVEIKKHASEFESYIAGACFASISQCATTPSLCCLSVFGILVGAGGTMRIVRVVAHRSRCCTLSMPDTDVQQLVKLTYS